jgi:hypothetical protein
MVLMAAMIGQAAVDGPRTGPGLSEQARKAQARALAEFRANEHTIKSRLAAYYQLENERLGDRVQTVDIATQRQWSLITGSSRYGVAEGGRGFASVPPSGTPNVAGPRDAPCLDELRRENFLLKGRLRDSAFLYREASRSYGTEYPIRYRLAGCGVR